MATVVNARDVLLQAASPRVATIAMASNLVVSQDQVDGLGLVIDGTRLVWLTATTQVFQIAKTGTVSPSSTTLTATVRNLTQTPTLTVTSGTITPTPTLSSGQVTIQYTHLMTDTATIRLTVVEDSVTYSDEITLVKVREGIDSLNGLLTNEAHTITADYLGNPLSYTGAGGTFKVFQGVNDITTLCTFSTVSNPSSLTHSINASTGVYSVTGGYPTGTDLTTITYRATFGSSTIDKVFTIAKAKAATPSKTLTLSATSQVFQIAKNGTVTPSAITFTASNNNLTGSPSYSTSPTVTLTNVSGNSAELTYANMASNDAVTVTVTHDGIEDKITVVKVREGTDTITSVISNEAHTVPADNDGSNVNYAGASTTMAVYQGATDVSNLWAYSTAATNCTVSPTSIAAGTDPKTFTVSAMTANIAYVDITATRTGYPSQVKRFTVTKARAGVTGSNGSNGQRGSRTFYVALTGSTNTWSDSLATTTASTDGGPILNDTVVQYNNSENFSQTKFWNGSSWVTVNAIVDGNLLVSGTVGAAKLSANSVTADKIEANAVTSAKINANAVTADKINTGAVTAAKIDVSYLSAIKSLIGQVEIDTQGHIRTTGATAYGTGVGIWTGYADGAYKFRIGNPGGNGVFWDGTNLNIQGGGTFSGALSAATGSFAGSLSAATGSFAGSLSAASGTFSGTLTAQVVETTNIVGAAVTSAAAASGTSSTSISITAPSGSSSLVILADPGWVEAGGESNGFAAALLTLTVNSSPVVSDRPGFMQHVITNPSGTYNIDITSDISGSTPSGVTCSVSALLTKR